MLQVEEFFNTVFFVSKFSITRVFLRFGDSFNTFLVVVNVFDTFASLGAFISQFVIWVSFFFFIFIVFIFIFIFIIFIVITAFFGIFTATFFRFLGFFGRFFNLFFFFFL